MPLPAGTSVTMCRRTGRYLCYADAENYNVVDLESGQLLPLMPITQAPVPIPLRPSITPVGAAEFLILSWTGVSALGVFITGTGEPVRGTLEWPAYPDAVCEYAC
jgi:vacuolar protein sorting-associated protein 3